MRPRKTSNRGDEGVPLAAEPPQDHDAVVSHPYVRTSIGSSTSASQEAVHDALTALDTMQSLTAASTASEHDPEAIELNARATPTQSRPTLSVSEVRVSFVEPPAQTDEQMAASSSLTHDAIETTFGEEASGANEDAQSYGDEVLVEDDGGIIRCICECDDDDGFTIQCDSCLVWQHCACFGMSQASVPDEYRCEQCDPRPVDVAYAKEHQRRRREAESRRSLAQRTVRRQSLAETQYFDSAAPTAATGKAEDGTGLLTLMTGSEQNSRARNASQPFDATLPSPSGDRSPSAQASGSRPSHRKRVSTATRPLSRRGDTSGARGLQPSRDEATVSTPTAATSTQREEFFDLNDASLDPSEAWHVEFTPISDNIVVNEAIAETLLAMSRQAEVSRDCSIAEPGTGTRMIAPVVGKRVKTLANLSAQEAAAREENVDGEASKDSSLGQSEVLSQPGLSATGRECTAIEIAASSLSSCSQKTYVRQISELASSGIFNAVMQIARLPSEPQRSSSANRMFSKPVMHGLFADVSIPAGCFICEFNGELYSADHYRQDPVNQYRVVGASKPATHVLPPPLNICIDARKYGNHSRFARFSCHPNAVIRPVLFRRRLAAERISEDSTEQAGVVGESRDATAASLDADDAKVVFGLFAIADICQVPRDHIRLGVG